jgi:hypothetical protein
MFNVELVYLDLLVSLNKKASVFSDPHLRDAWRRNTRDDVDCDSYHRYTTKEAKVVTISQPYFNPNVRIDTHASRTSQATINQMKRHDTQ